MYFLWVGFRLCFVVSRVADEIWHFRSHPPVFDGVLVAFWPLLLRQPLFLFDIANLASGIIICKKLALKISILFVKSQFAYGFKLFLAIPCDL